MTRRVHGVYGLVMHLFPSKNAPEQVSSRDAPEQVRKPVLGICYIRCRRKAHTHLIGGAEGAVVTHDTSSAHTPLAQVPLMLTSHDMT